MKIFQDQNKEKIILEFYVFVPQPFVIGHTKQSIEQTAHYFNRNLTSF